MAVGSFMSLAASYASTCDRKKNACQRLHQIPRDMATLDVDRHVRMLQRLMLMVTLLSYDVVSTSLNCHLFAFLTSYSRGLPASRESPRRVHQDDKQTSTQCAACRCAPHPLELVSAEIKTNKSVAFLSLTQQAILGRTRKCYMHGQEATIFGQFAEPTPRSQVYSHHLP